MEMKRNTENTAQALPTCYLVVSGFRDHRLNEEIKNNRKYNCCLKQSRTVHLELGNPTTEFLGI
jgi:hypothetical protein